MTMGKQMGNSRRGPDDLDRAQDSQLGAQADADLDDRDTEQLLADGEMVGEWSDEEDEGGLLAGDESVGPWSDDDLESGYSADSAGDQDVEQRLEQDEPRDPHTRR
jgi:hypothetical protein